MRNLTSLLLVLLTLHVCSPLTRAAEPEVSFRKDIAPLLLEHCLACHGAKKAEGGYRVDTYDELLKPGDSEEVPVAKEKGAVSELLRRLTCDESERMPAESEPLTSEQIALVKTWIEAGGVFDGSDGSEQLMRVIPPPTYADPPENYSRAVPVVAVQFSPDGTQVVTGGLHEVLVWNAADSSLVRRIKNIGQRVYDLAFSSDGAMLAVACGEPGKSGEVRLVDFSTGEIKGVIARSDDVLFDLAFRPNSNELAIATSDSSIRIFDVQTQQETRTIASHADWVTAVCWSEDGKQMASASRDKSAKVYDAETGSLVTTYLGHGAAVRGVAFTADGTQVLTSGADAKLHRWNASDGKRTALVGLGGDAFKLIRIGDKVFVPCASHKMLRIDLTSNKVDLEFVGHADWVLSLALQANAEGAGQKMLTGGFDGEVRVWNFADAAPQLNWIAKP
ncbi:WD domain, G-beta repeat [Roseimaritima multifibrata]|uniref:WD domain, G-beta repeat n=1 Tax=Roseimaritima multifibrata TaxID=1930274 RepID=A0A517MLF7_9BACT|nr:c-type cytochrome domain-containing protein [Roseimaritima multifibrata]QDS95709.1 WD domain, G-beta repeat [Roseimaritima multifibrata]